MSFKRFSIARFSYGSDGNATDIDGQTFESKQNEIFFEKVEVRAFGVLVRDMAGLLTSSTPANDILIKSLANIQSLCLNDDVIARPTFGTLQGLVETEYNLFNISSPVPETSFGN